jgi:hypothetical protein
MRRAHSRPKLSNSSPCRPLMGAAGRELLEKVGTLGIGSASADDRHVGPLNWAASEWSCSITPMSSTMR